MKVEVHVLGSLALIVPMVSVDVIVKQHLKKKKNRSVDWCIATVQCSDHYVTYSWLVPSVVGRPCFF